MLESVEEKLLCAIKKGDLGKVRKLVEFGTLFLPAANVNIRYSDGTTPLYVAYAESKPDIIYYLRKREDTIIGAAKVAIEKGNLSLFQLITDKQSLSEMNDSERYELYRMTEQYQQPDMALHMIKNDMAWICEGFLYAIKTGDVETLKTHIQQGEININKTDFSGLTPLHWAAASGQTEVAKLLIQNGANVLLEGLMSHKGEDGQTTRIYGRPSRMAKKLGFNETAGYLKNCEVKVESEQVSLAEVGADLKAIKRRQKPVKEDIRETALKITEGINSATDIIKKMALVGCLCDLFETITYEQGVSLHKELAPKMDKDVRGKVEKIIRDGR